MDHEYFKGNWRRKLSSIRKEGQRNKCAFFCMFICFIIFKQSGQILVCTLKYIVFMVYTYN